MDRNTQQLIVQIGTATLALGVIGYFIWKVGVLDMLLQLVAFAAFTIVVVGIAMHVVDPIVYDNTAGNINEAIAKVQSMFTKKAKEQQAPVE
jgi:hypothetical protein